MGESGQEPCRGPQEASPQLPAPAGPQSGAHLDVVALPHAGANGVQASGQVGRAAALAEVVGNAAGEAQRSKSAAQTWAGRRRSGAGPAGASQRLRPGEGHG